ncbi:hypothetical protein [Pseudomonas sp. TH31]|uniref:hypothetical protein n=1 Tax=Pseudomonas sp. TH31 TaxID=2796396 RepID=UPI001913008E|nr:hypothetical protein [Pseudomonas sp. TH31]MBK5417733.1 hypothetical protein [Pseudomonas sp. TH31]
MTTNKKRPSDLVTVWDKNLDSVIHVHRPGNSQKATVRQVVDAVVAAIPTPDPGEEVPVSGIETGAVVMLPEGSYADYFECDGSIKQSSLASELAGIINGGTPKYQSILSSSVARKSLTTGEVLDAVYFKGLLFTVNSVSPFITAYDSSFNLVYSNATALSHKRLVVTDNAVYFLNGSYNIYCIQVSGSTVTAAYTGESSQASNGGFSAVSVSADEDLFCWISLRRLYSPKTNTKRIINGVFSIGGLDQGSTILKTDSGRIFFVGTFGASAPGLYEMFLDTAVPTVSSARLIQSIYPAPDTIKCTGDFVYFGVAGIQYKLNAKTDRVTSVTSPFFVNASAVTHSIACHNNFLFVNGLRATANNFGHVSFDYGNTFSKLPAFNTKIAGMLIDPVAHKALYFGDSGTIGSADGSAGNVEIHQLTLLDNNYFKLPLVTGACEGYRFYVKK